MQKVLTLFTSKVTWAIIITFVIAGMEAVGWIPVATATTIQGLLSLYGLTVHNSQIGAGKVARPQ
jgi:hypothetical protein